MSQIQITCHWLNFTGKLFFLNFPNKLLRCYESQFDEKGFIISLLYKNSRQWLRVGVLSLKANLNRACNLFNFAVTSSSLSKSHNLIVSRAFRVINFMNDGKFSSIDEWNLKLFLTANAWNLSPDLINCQRFNLTKDVHWHFSGEKCDP